MEIMTHRRGFDCGLWPDNVYIRSCSFTCNSDGLKTFITWKSTRIDSTCVECYENSCKVEWLNVCQMLLSSTLRPVKVGASASEAPWHLHWRHAVPGVLYSRPAGGSRDLQRDTISGCPSTPQPLHCYITPFWDNCPPQAIWPSALHRRTYTPRCGQPTLRAGLLNQVYGNLFFVFV